jgi:hypothetical protein
VGYSPCSSYQRQLGANEIDQMMPATLSMQSKISSIRQTGVENIEKFVENFLCWQKEKREGRKRGKERKERKKRGERNKKRRKEKE